MDYGVHMVTNSPSTVTAALGRVVDFHLRDKRITRTQVAAKLGIGRETLTRRIDGPDGLYMAELEGVAVLLDTTPAALTAEAQRLAEAGNQAIREAG